MQVHKIINHDSRSLHHGTVTIISRMGSTAATHGNFHTFRLQITLGCGCSREPERISRRERDHHNGWVAAKKATGASIPVPKYRAGCWSWPVGPFLSQARWEVVSAGLWQVKETDRVPQGHSSALYSNLGLGAPLTIADPAAERAMSASLVGEFRLFRFQVAPPL